MATILMWGGGLTLILHFSAGICKVLPLHDFFGGAGVAQPLASKTLHSCPSFDRGLERAHLVVHGNSIDSCSRSPVEYLTSHWKLLIIVNV